MNTDINKDTGKSQSISSKIFLVMMLAWILSLAGQATCFAENVALSWDPNTESTLAGYKVYYSADDTTMPFDGTGAVEGASPIDVHNKATTTVSGLDPGRTYYFAITAYNTSGVESAYSSIVTILESVAPTVAVSAPANNATVSGTVSVTANASDNVGVTKVEYYVNGVLKATDTTTPYVYSWNTSSLSTGSYILTAKAYDAAGNVGQSGNVTVTVVNDTTAPVISLSAPGNSATVSGTVAITASASDNVGVSRVEFYENGTLLFAGNTPPYSYNWNTVSLSNGSYALIAKAYDAVGNVGQSSTVTVTVNNPVSDTTAPTVSITSPAASATVSGTATVSATASDNVGVTKVEFYVNGVLKATDTASPYSFSWDTTSAANGAYTLTTKAYDAANNAGQSSAVTITVNNTVSDTTPPTVSISSPSASATVSGTATVSATASDNVGVTKVEFYVNGVLKATDTASPYNFSWYTTSAANGAYTLTAKAYDAAGNVGQSSAIAVTVSNPILDTTLPTVAIISPSNNGTVTGTATVTASASDNTSVTKVEFYVNGAIYATTTVAPYSFTTNTATIANGTYTITAKAYDAAGNIGQSAAVTISVNNPTTDTTAPIVSITSPAGGAAVSGTATVTASATDNVGVTKVEFYVNGALSATSTSAPYNFTWNTATIANGSYALTAKAYDAAGNVGQSANLSFTVNNASPLSVSITNPANGSTVSGIKTVTVSARGDKAITKVQLYVNGKLYGTKQFFIATTQVSSNFSWRTSALPKGTYDLTAKAYDKSGQTVWSAVVTPTVANTTRILFSVK